MTWKSTKADEILYAGMGFICVVLGFFSAVMTIVNWTELNTDAQWIATFFSAGWLAGGIWLLKESLPIRPRTYRTRCDSDS